MVEPSRDRLPFTSYNGVNRPLGIASHLARQPGPSIRLAAYFVPLSSIRCWYTNDAATPPNTGPIQ